MSKLIYVVDDEPEICELLKIALESRGFKVKTANNGEAALKMVKKKRPDLLIIDLKMPRKNGYEVISELKATGKFDTLPIMVLTSLTQGSRKSDEEWRSSLGISDFITKPFDALEIIKRVQAVVS